MLSTAESRLSFSSNHQNCFSTKRSSITTFTASSIDDVFLFVIFSISVKELILSNLYKSISSSNHRSIFNFSQSS